MSNYVKGDTPKIILSTETNYVKYTESITYITSLSQESLQQEFVSLPNYNDNKDQIDKLLEYIMKIKEIILEFNDKTS